MINYYYYHCDNKFKINKEYLSMSIRLVLTIALLTAYTNS